MSKDNTILIGAGLIVAAVMLTRRSAMPYGQPFAQAGGGAPARGPLGSGSMPGSVGSGIAQQIGGIIGNSIVKQFGGGTANGAPPSNTAYNVTPALAGDGVIQNSVDAADPAATFDPGFNLTDDYGVGAWA
jgi:hypothetical protein